MATTTTKHSFPVPSADGSDPPAGHTQIKALGDDIDSKWPVRFKGKSIIATEQTTDDVTANQFQTLGTPDRVQNVVLPTDGLILVHFRALAKYFGSFAGEAAIFLGNNQLKTQTAGGAPAVQKASIDDTDYQWVSSVGNGLIGGGTGSAASDGVTTGLSGNVLGPFCAIEAAAGTYTVQVCYRNLNISSGEGVTVKDRRLRVWTMEF